MNNGKIYRDAILIILTMSMIVGCSYKKPSKLNAAQYFEGYYLGKTEAMSEYCQGKGVDLSNYLTVYKDVEAKIYDKAIKVFNQNGLVFGEAYEKNRDFASQQVEKAMEIVRSSLNKQLNTGSVTVATACKLYNNVDRKSLEQYSFASEHPDMYKIIMN